MIFCDTSYAAKLYVPERESPGVRMHLESHPDDVCLSELAGAELMAVFHSRLREGHWTADQFRAAVRQFQQDDATGFWSWIPLDAPILRAASEVFVTLPSDVFLRTADCLHLVTARQNRFTEIHTFDRHQIAAAEALGLKAVGAPSP